jgi:peroxiredoxin
MYKTITRLKLTSTLLLSIIFIFTGCFAPQDQREQPAAQTERPVPAKLQNQAGQQDSSIQPAKIAPAIMNVRISKASDSAAWVTWQTDQPATTEIIYWEEGAQQKNTISEDISATIHFTRIQPIDKERTYAFVIKARSTDNSQTVSSYEGVLTIKIGAQVGQNAPDFELPAINGDADHPIELSHFRGRIVLLFFWDINCSSCKEKIPLLDEQFKRMDNNNYLIIAVHVPGQDAEIKRFYANYGLTLPVLFDADGKLSASYEVQGLPASYVIDRSGIIIAKNPNFKTQEELDRLIRDYVSR